MLKVILVSPLVWYRFIIIIHRCHWFCNGKMELQKRRMGNRESWTVLYFQLVEGREQLDSKRYLVSRVGSCHSVGSWKSSRLTAICEMERSWKVVLRPFQLTASWGYLLCFSPGPRTGNLSGVSTVVLMEKLDLPGTLLHLQYFQDTGDSAAAAVTVTGPSGRAMCLRKHWPRTGSCYWISVAFCQKGEDASGERGNAKHCALIQDG